MSTRVFHNGILVDIKCYHTNGDWVDVKPILEPGPLYSVPVKDLEFRELKPVIKESK